jgi:hypothetical protein
MSRLDLSTPFVLCQPLEHCLLPFPQIANSMSRTTWTRIVERFHFARLSCADLENRTTAEVVVLQTAQHRLRNFLGSSPLVLVGVEKGQLLGMFSPERRLDNTRRDSVDADTELRIQRGQ